MFKRVLPLSAVILLSSFYLLNAQTKIIAHRGASSLAPENTMASFQKAVDLKADCFELDVQRSLDDSLVIMHDATIDRTTNGTGSISNFTYAQLQTYDAGSWGQWAGSEFAGEKIPLLTQALDLAVASPYQVIVVIEIKTLNDTTVVEKVIKDVQKRNLQDRVIISSFSLERIQQSKQIDPSIPVQLFHSAANNTVIDQLNAFGAEWIGTGGAVTPTFLDYVHNKGMFLNKWTVNTTSDIKKFIDLGVDAVSTNYPQRASALLDTTPPSDVILNKAEVNVTTVKLTWQHATDDIGEIVGYEIYRDTDPNASVLLKTTDSVTTYIDHTHTENETFFYRIKAINIAGLTSENFSNELSATTVTDTRPPKVRTITAFGENDKIIVEFNELLDQTSAENTANYSISGGITVNSAKLTLDSSQVSLSTSALTENTTYTATISGINDRANIPNTITDPLVLDFTFTAFLSNTVASWSSDEGDGTVINDASGNNNTGTLENGVAWSAGLVGNGLEFDGVDDYVSIPNSTALDINTNTVTISVWVKLAYLPNELSGAYGPIYDSETDNYVIYEDKGNNELRFKVTTDVSAERPGIPANQLEKNKWLHIVGVYDGSTAKIFLNGVTKDLHNLTGNVKPGQVATIGKTGTVYFKGNMDNIQIFDRALTQNEINYLYSEFRTSYIDVDLPEIADVTSLGSNTKVYLKFNEEVEKFSSEVIDNYQIYTNIGIDSVQLSVDQKTVVLTTSLPLQEGILYAIRVNDIVDQADEPNKIADNSTAYFTHKSFPASLVSSWSFDENTDTTSWDEGKNNNNIILKNDLQRLEGKYGNGLFFDGEDGVDDYAQVPNSTSLDIDTNGVTVSAWVKLKYLPTDLPNPYGPIYDSGTDNYVFYEDRGNKELRFKVTTVTNGAQRPGIPEADLVLDEWIHIVGIYNGSSTRIYMNGELKDEHQGPNGNIKPGQVARLGQDGTSWFSGSIDQVNVFNRGLTEQEVVYLYSGEKTPDLSIDNVAETAITLTWQHDLDPLSSVSGYNIYKDTTDAPSVLYATLGDTTKFTDYTENEFSTFYYRIKSINDQGVESNFYSNMVSATTGADVTSPEIKIIYANGEAAKVYVNFSEKVDKTTAGNAANYSLNNSAVVDSVRITLDNYGVMLFTTGLAEGIDYTLTVNNVTDVAATPNPIAGNTQKSFNYYPFFSDLIAYWPLDDGVDTTAFDVSGFNNNAHLSNNPAWIGGMYGNALSFDGVDDYVEIPNSPVLNIDTNSVTLTLWVKLKYLPTEMPTGIGPIYDAGLDRYVIYEDRGNKELRFKVTTFNGAERPGIPEANLKTDEWLFITGVYDGSKAMIYMNGQLMDMHENLTGNVRPDQIARLGQDGAHYFKGEIDNVQVYKRALSDAEILYLYSNKNYPTGIEDEHLGLPVKYSLAQNYPNPFNPATTLSYTIIQKEHVKLVIYDLLGRKVKELVNKNQIPGNYKITWNGLNDSGQKISSGIYICKINAGKFTATRKMVLIK